MHNFESHCQDVLSVFGMKCAHSFKLFMFIYACGRYMCEWERENVCACMCICVCMHTCVCEREIQAVVVLMSIQIMFLWSGDTSSTVMDVLPQLLLSVPE